MKKGGVWEVGGVGAGGQCEGGEVHSPKFILGDSHNMFCISLYVLASCSLKHGLIKDLYLNMCHINIFSIVFRFANGLMHD